MFFSSVIIRKASAIGSNYEHPNLIRVSSQSNQDLPHTTSMGEAPRKTQMAILGCTAVRLCFPCTAALSDIHPPMFMAGHGFV
jgi:hypothetical protein